MNARDTIRAFAASIVTGALWAASVGGLMGQQPETQDLTRYQVIIERSPFGSLPGVAPGTPQPNFAARFAFVGLVSSEDNTQVLAIIQDRERNRTYFQAEGEMVGQLGVKVMRIDRTAGKVVLQQGLEVATLAYEPRGSGPAMPGVGQEPAAAPTGPVPRRIPFRRGG